MAEAKSKTTAGCSQETIVRLDTEKFTFAYDSVPGFKSVALGIWFPVGSRYEPERLRGISHFIEHLIFKGTKKYNAQKVSEIFDSLGARVNAFTGKEMTCYYIHLLSDNLPQALNLLVHILKEPAFRKKDIESERKVIIQEIAMYEDSPDELIHDYFAEAAFKGSSLGSSIIGTKETISSIEKEDLAGFYDSFYRSNRFYVTAAGNVDPETVLSAVESIDGSVKELAVPEKQLFEKDGNHKLVTKDTAQTHICVGFRTFGAGSPDRFALAVLDSLFGGMMSSRLFKEIREKRGLAYSTYSYSTYFKDAGYICAYAGTSHEKVYDVLKIILDEYRKLFEEEVPEEELSKARENVKSSLVLASESMKARMSYLGKSLISKEKIITIQETIDRVSAVTSKDIRRLAEKYFKEKPVIAAIGKFEKEKILSISGH